MKLLPLLLIGLALSAEDQPKPTIEQLQQQIAQDRAELEKLQKLLIAWQNQAFGCIGQAVNEKALAPQPQQKPEAKK